VFSWVNDKTIWVVTALAALAAWLITRWWAWRNAPRARAMRHRLHDGSLSPRGQHYYFAHSALRGMAIEDPEGLIVKLSGEDAEQTLADLWLAVGRDVRASGEDGDEGVTLPADGLEAIPSHLPGRPAVVVRLPEPRAATEAYFVAVVLNHEIGDPAKSGPEPAAYYFTLEKGFSLDPAVSPRTAFCEWDGAAHKNYGDGPPPDARRFLEAIVKHLAAADRAPRATAQGEGRRRKRG
jgi:hypothetical protein